MVWGSDARRKTYRKKYGLMRKRGRPKAKTAVDKQQNKRIRKIMKIVKSDDSYYNKHLSGVNTKTWTNLVINDSYGLINGLTQGAGTGQRVGDVITMKSLTWRMFIQGNNSGAGGEIFFPFRLLIFIDKNPNGTFPTTADILQVPSNMASDDVTNFYAPITKEFRKNYKILHDVSYANNGASSIYNTTSMASVIQKKGKFINLSFNLKDMPVQYIKGTTNGQISNFATNALWYVLFSRYDDGCGANITYTLNYSQ